MTARIVARRARDADCAELIEMYASAPLMAGGGRRDMLKAGLRALLADPALGFLVVAEAQRRIVGMLRVCYEWSPYRNGMMWWIENVYVKPEWRRKGVYKAMHAHVLAATHDDPHARGLRLYTEEDNHAARRAYQNVGMRGRMVEFFELDFVYGPPSERRDAPHDV